MTKNYPTIENKKKVIRHVVVSIVTIICIMSFSSTIIAQTTDNQSGFDRINKKKVHKTEKSHKNAIINNAKPQIVYLKGEYASEDQHIETIPELINPNTEEDNYSLEALEPSPHSVDENQGSMKDLNHVSIFPNPAESKAILEFYASGKNEIVIEIFNSIGKLLATKTYKNASGTVQKEINLTGYKSGVYLVRFTADWKAVTKQLIKR